MGEKNTQIVGSVGGIVYILFPVCLRSSTQTEVMQGGPRVGVVKVWVAQCPGRERTAKYIDRN